MDPLNRKRNGPLPRYSVTIPQVQLDQNCAKKYQDLIVQHVSQKPGIRVGASGVGEPDTRAFHIDQTLAKGPRDAFLIDNEFAHVHREQDGSLHMPIAPNLLTLAYENQWAVPHPLAGKQFSNVHSHGELFTVSPYNSLVFGPRDDDELKVVLFLLDASYDRAIGS